MDRTTRPGPGATHELSEAKRALLERHLRGEMAIRGHAATAVTPRGSKVTTPLSYGQEQLTFIARLAPNVPVYNESVTVYRNGPLDSRVLRHALNEIVSRHEAWRTTFATDGATARQRVHRPRPVDLLEVDLSDVPAERREVEAQARAREEMRRAFDLATGPLVRPLLVHLGPEDHRLYVTMHHIVFDGVALAEVFLPELVALYEAFAAGAPSPLPPPGLQHGDFAVWERAWVEGPEVQAQVAWWRANLAGAPLLELPTDHPRPAVPTFAGVTELLSFDAGVQARLAAFCRAEGATLHSALAAALLVLIHRYTGQEDLVVGTISAGRRRPELERLLGYFLNPLTLRTDLSGEPGFREVVRRARETSLAALSHADVPFQRLVQELVPTRDMSRNPLFQVLFSLQPALAPHPPGWDMVRTETDSGTSKFDLSVEVEERPGGLSGRLIGSADLFEPQTLTRMARHFEQVVEAVLRRPDAPLHSIPLLSEAETRTAVVLWNDTAAEYPSESLPALVDAQARLTPDRVAVEAPNGTVTYSELVGRANHVAHRLRGLGVGPEVIVGVCLERSLHTIIGVLGVLKAGGAYVPLDPAFPSARLGHMLEDSAAVVLLTQRSLVEGLPPHNATVLCIDDDEGLADDPPPGEVDPASTAYVLYTSGSTGTPKGVQIEHRSLVNFLWSMRRRPGLTENDVLLAVTTLSFDIAGLELYLPLVTGARIVMASRATAADGRGLLDLLDGAGITFLQATPTTWRLLIEAGWTGTAGLKALCGGEALPTSLAEALLARVGELWNVYGPTETTIWSAAKRVERSSRAMTIGKPIANTQLYVLGKGGGPQPVGVPGEIVIGGDGVARGYLNRAELTAERFVPDTLSGAQGARLYRTGDLGRYRPGGEIEFLGRLDHQVKVRGFRIELGEIEAGLLQFPGITAAVVVARGDPSEDQRLVGYLVTPGGARPATAELRSHLRRTLPDYMVPSAFVSLAAFPTTPNGKLDRAALPEPDAQVEVRNALVPPRNETESRLVEIWRRVLKVPAVGVRDDFFELGGHSLLAVRLMAEVEKAFHRRLSLASFFEGEGTIESLATTLAADGSREADSPVLVAMNAGGHRPPLFFVHPDDESIFSLRHFLEALGTQQPIIGLIPQREGRRYNRGRSVEDLAAGMVELVQQKQPTGDLHVCGYCFGGVLAYEMVRQLREAHREVVFLGLIDTLSPAASAVEGSYVARTMRPSARLARLLGHGPRAGWQRARVVLARNARRAWAARPGAVRTGDYDIRTTFALTTAYAPPDIDVPLTLFHNTIDWYPGGEYMGWADVCTSRIDTHGVPGNHLSMLQQPQVQVLAGALADRLEAAVREPDQYSAVAG